jgi:EAL and modified HD-GYP domain-containing signal transduction protein
MDKSQSKVAVNNEVVFVARQPISSRSNDLFAYELLYRHDALERMLAARDEQARPEAFLNTFLDFGLQPGRLAFIDVTRMVILQGYCKALPRVGVVLQVPRDVEPGESVILSLTELTKLGYELALDDFEYSERTRPMLELVNYGNLNFEILPQEEISKQLSILKQSKAKAIAKRVQTHEVFEVAKSMGFEYFSGSYWTKPKLTPSTHVPINRLSMLQLVLKLQEPELSTVELETLVAQDLAISYKLLQYVNSAALSLSRSIESIRAAIQLVGVEQLRTWASFLYLAKLADKPAELIVTAFVRAKMAECLATSMGAGKPETYYMAGLFSLVGALLNVPMPEAIQLLPFSKQLRQALLSFEGPMGSVLRCVLAYESGDWDNSRCGGLAAATIRQCYLDAIASARKMPGNSGTVA